MTIDASDQARAAAIASIVGPTMVAIGASEIVTREIWRSNIDPLIYLGGVLLFVSGLAILRGYRSRRRGWPMLLTATGWVGVIGGLFRMFFPGVQRAAENTPTTIVSAGIVGIVGVILTVNAYRHGRPAIRS